MESDVVGVGGTTLRVGRSVVEFEAGGFAATLSAIIDIAAASGVPLPDGSLHCSGDMTSGELTTWELTLGKLTTGERRRARWDGYR
jgi:hypothetical protein